MFRFRTLAAILVAAGLAAASLRADEGMWTFDNFPSARVNAKYGVTVTDAFLSRLQQSAARLASGCSASVVTATGLVLTNHHCVRECVANLSTSQVDYIKDGFSADATSEERKCAGIQAEILTSIADVTERVKTAAAGKAGREFVSSRDAAIAAIEKEGCAGREATFRCQVVTLYQGGQYKLYTYRTYSDVRLVFAPEGATAFFGGDPDNFNFPRYDLDAAFLRLYENDRPVATPIHLDWSTTAPAPGSVVFVAGNPGTTQRLLTADQLQTLRDTILPDTLFWMAELRGRLIQFSEESAEHARVAEDFLFSIENSFKVYRGQLQALSAPGFIDDKKKSDESLRATASAAAEGDPWAEIARVQTARRTLAQPYTYLESRAAYGSDLFRFARTLVRAAEERAKANSDRLPEYTDSRLPLLERQLLNPVPIYPDVERLALEFWLSKLRENLTADAPATKTVLGTDSPEVIAQRLVASKLGDPSVRKALWDGGLNAVRASADPMIKFVLATDRATRDVRQAYETEVSGPTDRAAGRIAEIRFAALGTGTYPDATFTPRVTFGTVKGWAEGGRTVEPFTRFAGLWERATDYFPFKLAPRWQAARGRIDDTVAFNMVTDTDIIGGNSGSPVVDINGGVVGAIFDGNIHSLGGAFGFDENLNRSVSVTTAAITEALDKVYGARALLKELTAR
jgi:hypothetical protein